MQTQCRFLSSGDGGKIPGPPNTRSYLRRAGEQLVLFLLLVLPIAVSAQAYDGRACEEGNADLRTLLKKGELDSMPLHLGITGDADRWATSFLKAEGQPPQRMPDYDEDLDGDMDVHDWTCMFAAFRAFDRNQDTAWSEGVDGPGIGEVLLAPVEDSSKPIRIRAGFSITRSLYLANNRPRKIRVYALTAFNREAHQIGLIYSDWKVLAKKEFELKDINDWQVIRLPRHQTKEGVSFIAIEILSVYRGSRYNDTLISEIMN
jgi:hypothetical protein